MGNLFGILLRLREERVALTGDVSKMFLQIRLPEKDIHVHRYLWRELNTKKSPDIYALERVTSGVKSSPDMANFVMLKMAKDNEEEYPRAALTIRRDRYMDDLIHFCSTEEEARGSKLHIHKFYCIYCIH